MGYIWKEILQIGLEHKLLSFVVTGVLDIVSPFDAAKCIFRYGEVSNQIAVDAFLDFLQLIFGRVDGARPEFAKPQVLGLVAFFVPLFVRLVPKKL